MLYFDSIDRRFLQSIVYIFCNIYEIAAAQINTIIKKEGVS